VTSEQAIYTTAGQKVNVDPMVMHFSKGLPQLEGWYFVKLLPGHTSGNKKYDVDYCRYKSPSDGGGMEWVTWYNHNIDCWCLLSA